MTNEWVSGSEAEKLASVGRRQLNRLAVSGVIERKREEGGVWQYRAEDCAKYAAGDEVAAEQVADTMLGQAYGLVNTLIGPAKQFCELLQRENAALRSRCEKLELRHDELIAAREDLLNMKVERELAQDHAKQVDSRKERMFKLVENNIGPQLLSSIGSGGGQTLKAARGLIESLQPEQVELLLDTELMTQEQKGHLKSLVEASGGKLERSESA